MKIVYRTDVHLASQSPQSRVDDWATTVLGKLEQVNQIAKDVGAVAIFDNGDFFHIKTPSRTTHELIGRVAQVHAHDIPVYANIGNHDCKYGDMAFLNEAPLGVLFDTGVFRRCYNQHEVILEGDGCKVRVVGIPYHGKSYDMSRLTSLVKGDEDYLVVMAHLLASPEGGEMFGSEDIVRYTDLANLAPDIFFFGHWHKNQGVQKVGEKIIVNIGSLTRGALSEDEVSRVPECAVVEFSPKGIFVERVPLRVAPASEVFDLVGRVQQEARTMTVEAFVESIKTTLTAASTESLSDQVKALDVDDKVRERMLAYLESANA